MHREARLRSIRKANDLIPEEDKHRRVQTHIKNNTLFINKVPQKKHIHPLTVQDIFNCDKETAATMNAVNLVHTEAVTDKLSHFRGHVAKVKNSKEINAAYKKIRLLYPESNHIMMAYTIKNHTGFHDDGEYSAGDKLLQILLQRCLNNMVVFVMREFGGPPTGPKKVPPHRENCKRCFRFSYGIDRPFMPR